MIRAALTADATNAMMLVTPTKGLAFQRRRQAAGATTITSVRQGKAPIWLKLERRGNTIRSFYSADGLTWTLVGSDTVTMALEVYVGLAVSSGVQGRLVTAAFDTVLVTAR